MIDCDNFILLSQILAIFTGLICLCKREMLYMCLLQEDVFCP